jgi:hypothetical protein
MKYLTFGWHFSGLLVGSVYVYGSTGNVWSRQSKLVAKDGAGGDNYGIYVSIFDTKAMIGANSDDDKGLNTGTMRRIEIS